MHHDRKRRTVTAVFQQVSDGSLGVSSKRAAITVSVTSETAVGYSIASWIFQLLRSSSQEPLLLMNHDACC